MERKIAFYGNYFSKFYEKQNNKTRDKIDYIIDIIRFVDRVPIQFLKYLEGTESLYEIRISTTLNKFGYSVFSMKGRLLY